MKDLRKEVMRLQEENLNLQFQISSLAQPAGNLQPQAQTVELGSSEVPAKPVLTTSVGKRVMLSLKEHKLHSLQS